MRVFILQGETLDPTTTANPPACFRLSEWTGYCEMVRGIGFRVPGEQPGPSRRPKYLQRESFDALRQARALREQACNDCTIAYQVAQRLGGRCHPVNFARTPIGRALEPGEEDGRREDETVIEPGSAGRPRGGKHDERRRETWRESRRRRLAREQTEAGL